MLTMVPSRMTINWAIPSTAENPPPPVVVGHVNGSLVATPVLQRHQCGHRILRQSSWEFPADSGCFGVLGIVRLPPYSMRIEGAGPQGDLHDGPVSQ